MFTGMGMRFQTGSEMGMKFEMIGSWNGNYLMRMGGNVSINCIAAQSVGHRADTVGTTPIQVYSGVRTVCYMGVVANPSETRCQIRAHRRVR